MTNTSGNILQHMQYLPFGEDLIDQRAQGYDGATYTFSGKQKDMATGYSYFGARYYDASISIWLSVDPKAAKFPSYSPYTYCFNNPIRLVDPDGRWLCEAKNVRETRKEARSSGGKFEKWTNEDTRKTWASVDYAKSDKYQGNAHAAVKVYKPEGKSWGRKN